MITDTLVTLGIIAAVWLGCTLHSIATDLRALRERGK